MNTWQKTDRNHPGIYLNLMMASTPVHATISTGTDPEQPATGRNARPRRDLARPAALRIRYHGKRSTSPLWPQALLRVIQFLPVQFLNSSRDHDNTSEDLRTAQRLHGCRHSDRTLDHGPGIPHLFSPEKELFTGHRRVFSPDIPESDISLSVQGHQNRTGQRPCQSLPFCTEIPCGEVSSYAGKNSRMQVPRHHFRRVRAYGSSPDIAERLVRSSH